MLDKGHGRDRSGGKREHGLRYQEGGHRGCNARSVPTKFMCGNRNAQCDDIKRRGFGEVMGHEGGAIVMGLVTSQEEAGGWLSRSLPAM